MVTNDEIILFVKDHAAVGGENINLDTDIFDELGCVGDDFHELIEKYTQRYSVDMSGYLWYFHSDEEGQNYGGVFFNPPYNRVKRIPVTPRMLTDFANQEKWNLDYPSHKLPKYRFDILFNYLLLLVFMFFVIKSCIK